ncbi:hypothetical protein [Vibrio alfacsensis]|uniref:hypothetical protein n=1 Tax=Vibrio alfacsensis TaxID=1074311 RepID=UPI004068352B
MFSKRSDTVIAFLALLVSAFTFYYTTEQFKASDRHNKLSVTPNLRFWLDENQRTDTFTLKLINNGIGPARIKSFELTYKQNRYAFPKRPEWEQVFQHIGMILAVTEADIDWLQSGDVLAVGDEFTIYRFKVSGKVPEIALMASLLELSGEEHDSTDLESQEQKDINYQELRKKLKDLQVSIAYESFYDEEMPPVSFVLN